MGRPSAVGLASWRARVDDRRLIHAGTLRGVRVAPIVAIASAVTLFGCVLLVGESTPNGDQFSSTCTLLDTTSACGACVAASCSNLVTACCTDDTCKNVLKQFDTCADAGTCTVDLSSTAASNLATCIHGSCTMCVVTNLASDGGGNTTSVNCDNEPELDECYCQGGEPGSPIVPCNTSTVTDAVCCADSLYPNSGNCSCTTLRCSGDSTSCMCSTSADTNFTACNTGGFTRCCMFTGSAFCSCDNDDTECGEDTVSVTDCYQPQNVQCGSNQTWVTGCSLN